MSAEIVEVDFPGGKRVDARVGGFVIKTDQPRKHGGEESGPAPFDLFIASIASCAGIYALGFCQSRDLSTAGLGLRMMCEHDDGKKMITHISLHLDLPNGFPEKYRKGIIRAMEQCAVKKHILDAPAFSVELHQATGQAAG